MLEHLLFPYYRSNLFEMQARCVQLCSVRNNNILLSKYNSEVYVYIIFVHFCQ